MDIYDWKIKQLNGTFFNTYALELLKKKKKFGGGPRRLVCNLYLYKSYLKNDIYLY